MNSRKTIVRPPDAAVRVRKTYFDCRFGQLHVRTAFSSTGGFDEKTTLVCLHPAGASGRIFDGLLPLMATDRSIYAPDAPGCGESDLTGDASGAYAAALTDFLDNMRLRQIDVLAVGDSVTAAAEVMRARPELVRKRLDFPANDMGTVQAQPDAIARRARSFLD
jgi:pimeloyl-ACP methyl ester carboxylesterase